MTARNLLLLLLMLMGATQPEAYRSRRPSRFHRTRSWHRPRWHSASSHAKYRFKALYKDRYPRGPIYHRYAPFYRESASDDPYMIVIQLPKRPKYDDGRRYEKYGGRYDDYLTEDYEDDYDESEARTFRTGEKDVRVKVTKGTRPKVHIKISRKDKGSEIVGRSNVPGMQVSLRPEHFMNYRRANSRTIQQILLPPPPPSHSLPSRQSHHSGI